MNFSTTIKEAQERKDYDALVNTLPYARKLGVEIISVGDELIFKLPQKIENQGNPILPALHGGVIGGFMEMAATVEVLYLSESGKMPKVVDFSIDFLRPGYMHDSFAECQIVRQGRKIINVTINAWQTVRANPIATARAHFLLI